MSYATGPCADEKCSHAFCCEFRKNADLRAENDRLKDSVAGLKSSLSNSRSAFSDMSHELDETRAQLAEALRLGDAMADRGHAVAINAWRKFRETVKP